MQLDSNQDQESPLLALGKDADAREGASSPSDQPGIPAWAAAFAAILAAFFWAFCAALCKRAANIAITTLSDWLGTLGHPGCFPAADAQLQEGRAARLTCSSTFFLSFLPFLRQTRPQHQLPA